MKVSASKEQHGRVMLKRTTKVCLFELIVSTLPIALTNIEIVSVHRGYIYVCVQDAARGPRPVSFSTPSARLQAGVIMCSAFQ